MGKAIQKVKIFAKNNSSSGTSGISGSGTSSATALMSRFKIILTAAQVKTLSSIPIVLIPSPGANKIIYIDPHSIMIKLSSGTAFNFASGGGQGLSINTNSTFAFVPTANINDNTFLTTSGGHTYDISVISGNLIFGSDNNNSAVAIGIIGGSDATLGTRTITITFNYSIMDVS